MDSLTHIAVGAAAGEVLLGRRAGYKAMIWGAVITSVPDIDVFFGMFMSEMDKLIFHRGWTHSFIFILLTAPMFGWIINRFHQLENVGWKDWTLLSVVAMLVHILLDACTSYGTQLFLPFSDTAVAISSISIIDPIFSLPIFITLALAFRFKNSEKKKKVILIGLAISTFYLMLTLINRQYMQHAFERAMEREQHSWEEYQIKPTLFNNFLWRAVARNGETYYSGFHSLFDREPFPHIRRDEGKHSKLEPLLEHRAIQNFLWVSEGYYSVETENGELVLNDLRFGRMQEWDDPDSQFAFSYLVIEKEDGSIDLERVDLRFEGDRERQAFSSLIGRIQGR